MELSAGGTLSGEIIKALGNTLVQSLWQGIILAIAGGLIIIFTRRQTAALRYNLLIGAMALFMFGTVFTFFCELRPVPGIYPVQLAESRPVVDMPANVRSPVISSRGHIKQAFGDMLTGYFNEHYNTIVLIWFLIICAKSVRLAAGVYEVYQLRYSRTSPVSKYWEDKITELAVRLKIKRAIGLVESAIVRVPMVIGHLKPLILVPVGFINALPEAEVEAVLMHELAHIFRSDYLVNLLQSLMEIVFFFNPAVLWISQLAKSERENCCDDIALNQAASRADYISALLSCQEYRPDPGLSMALAGNKSNLLDRVKRIVNNNNQSLNIIEKTVLAICLVTAGLCILAFSTNKGIKTGAIQKNALVFNKAKLDTTVGSKLTYLFVAGNNTYKFNLDSAKIINLYVNGKKVPDNKTEKYEDEIASLLKANEKDNVLRSKDTAQSFKTRIFRPGDVGEGTAMRMVDSKKGKGQVVYIFKSNGVLYQVFIGHNRLTAVYVNGKPMPMGQYQSKIDDLLSEYNKKISRPLPPAGSDEPKNGEAFSATQNSSSNTSYTWVADTPAMPVRPSALAAPVTEKDRTNIEAIAILNKAGLIKDKNNFSFTIDNNDLMVNGRLQPDELQRKILSIYEKTPGETVNLTYSFRQSSSASK